MIVSDAETKKNYWFTVGYGMYLSFLALEPTQTLKQFDVKKIFKNVWNEATEPERTGITETRAFVKFRQGAQAAENGQ